MAPRPPPLPTPPPAPVPVPPPAPPPASGPLGPEGTGTEARGVTHGDGGALATGSCCAGVPLATTGLCLPGAAGPAGSATGPGAGSGAGSFGGTPATSLAPATEAGPAAALSPGAGSGPGGDNASLDAPATSSLAVPCAVRSPPPSAACTSRCCRVASFASRVSANTVARCASRWSANSVARAGAAAAIWARDSPGGVPVGECARGGVEGVLAATSSAPPAAPGPAAQPPSLRGL